ncbi:HhH-GPD superfamily base excision DNA repair protein, partial [Caldanaerobius fijiensis DSM 17918]
GWTPQLRTDGTFIEVSSGARSSPIHWRCSSLNRYPTPYELSSADLAELSSILKPLGLAYRAQRLKTLALIIVQEYNGVVPNKLDKLLSLPGIGNYVARAVMCFAFGEKYLPWDTNMVRISERVFGLKSSKTRPRDDVELADYVGTLLLTDGTIKETIWSLLDFAAQICTARKPKCRNCFGNKLCYYISF